MPRRSQQVGNRRWIFGLSAGVVLAAAAIVWWRLSVESPDARMVSMDQAVQTLRSEDGRLFASELTRQAEQARALTMDRWRLENARLFFLRDYDQVDSLATVAELLAVSGAKRTRSVKDSLRTRIEIEVALVKDQVAEMKTNLGQLPEMESLRHEILEAEASLLAVERRRLEGDLLGGAEALRKASGLLDHAGTTLGRVVSEYFDGIPQWKDWERETVAWSRTHKSVSLVIDKMAHRCIVYRNGKQVASFDVELGPQWIGPKRYEGDLSTPEGRYRVTRKRGPGQTIYHLALEINYPNEDDRLRFETARKNGTLPSRARLGGNIELHGNGGKTFNWTKGCIALSDHDIQKVYDLVSVGTPVTIVGSLANPFETADWAVVRPGAHSVEASSAPLSTQ